MICKDCKFWVENKVQLDGECRRYPPIPMLVPMQQYIMDQSLKQGIAMGIQSYFPRTKMDVNCGEYKSIHVDQYGRDTNDL